MDIGVKILMTYLVPHDSGGLQLKFKWELKSNLDKVFQNDPRMRWNLFILWHTKKKRHSGEGLPETEKGHCPVMGDCHLAELYY